DGGGGAIGVQNAGTSLTWNGSIQETSVGSGSLIKTGPGTLTLTSTNNYTGGTYVEGGTLAIGASGSVIPANTDVTVLSGATLLNLGDNTGTPVRAVTLKGGTVVCGGGVGIFSSSLYLNRVATDTTGGAVH